MAHCTDGFMGKPCGKKRRCAVCRAKWARSWSWVLRENLSLARCMTRMVTLTAPGADVLPWDDDVCRWRGPHKHSGPLGCRIDAQAAGVWRATLESNYYLLLVAARKKARVHEPVMLARAWEDQQRGAPHCHMVTAVTAAGERFVDALIELAPRYGFGEIRDRGYASKGAYAHAAYLANYVTKYDERIELDRRAMLFEAQFLPRQTIWVSPILTRRSGATMEVARLVRSLWAFAEGYRERPPRARDGVVSAWAFYWRRIGLRGREGRPRSSVPRSLVPRDYGSFAPWDTFSWPGEMWAGSAAAPLAA